jgi:hypothetical protein
MRISLKEILDVCLPQVPSSLLRRCILSFLSKYQLRRLLCPLSSQLVCSCMQRILPEHLSNMTTPSEDMLTSSMFIEIVPLELLRARVSFQRVIHLCMDNLLIYQLLKEFPFQRFSVHQSQWARESKREILNLRSLSVIQSNLQRLLASQNIEWTNSCGPKRSLLVLYKLEW